MQPSLRTPRLLLRGPVAADAAAIVALANDVDVVRRTARMPYPYTAQDARFFLETIVPAERVWAITLADALAGIVGIHAAHGDGGAELGYWLGRRFWGRGIATEAAAAIVDHALGALGLAALDAGYQLDNAASARVLAKLGFLSVGQEDRPCLALGRTVPVVLMRLERTPVAAFAAAGDADRSGRSGERA